MSLHSERKHHLCKGVLFVNAGQSPFDRLMSVLEERKQTMPEGSYTTKLMSGGVAKIGKKILEEAAEVVEAADEPGKAGHDHLVYEAGDLVYHLMVLLAHREVKWHEVADELARREGTSGLEEKASRKTQ